MNYRKDLAALSKEFPFDFINNVTGVRDPKHILHFHDCLEINYVTEGYGVNFIEDQEFDMKPGDLYIINNLEHHMAFSDDQTLRMKIILFNPLLIWQSNSFDYEYLTPFFKRSIKFSNCISRENPLSKELAVIIMEIEYEWLYKKEGFRLITKALLMKLLGLLYRHFKLNGEIGCDVKSFHKSYDRIRNVLEYINDNYNKELSLDELAKIAMMNRTYFCSYFKQVMQMTVSDYIQTLRINHVCNYLRTTNREIIEICSDCGFKSLSNFNKLFKQYIKITPSEYRLSQNPNFRL